ncbi:NAD-dependent epimerase/dehydratase family protein, partial [Streptomyces violascens]|uniref:NAD-dependent epimerase/dehydratase family protein n=1 Tax=Streptomyces violascens TaxID=67381 RepID=UPI0036D0BFDC
MRVLVTGGAGFIGSHIVTALAAHGHEPLILDRAVRPGDDVRDPDGGAAGRGGVGAGWHPAALVGSGTGVGRAL